MYFSTIFDTGLEAELTFANAEKNDTDCQVTRTISAGTATFGMTLHSRPNLKLARLGQFHELEVMYAHDLPHSYLGQCSAWNSALRKACGEFAQVGWLALRMPHASHLRDLAMHQGFFPTVDDEGVEVFIKYLPTQSASSLQWAEGESIMEMETSFGSVQLKSEGLLDLATCKYGEKNVGLRLFAPTCEKMPLLSINVVMNEARGCAPFFPYFAVASQLQGISHETLNSKLVSVVAQNRYEYMACLDAGFFPLEAKEKENETLFVRCF